MKSTTYLSSAIALGFILLFAKPGIAQFGQIDDLNPGYIKITEPGQLADTLSLWGDVGRSGRYIIPQGTTALELISYGGGFGSQRNINTNAFAKLRLYVSISRFNEARNEETVDRFKFKYTDPVPAELRYYRLSNEDVVTLQVKRKPAFIDYLGVIGPVLSAVVTSFVIYDQVIK